MHARTAASGQESTDFRGPIDLRDPEPSEQQAWAVELTPSALIVPEAPDLRLADADDGQEENHHTEVVAAPAAAAVAVAASAFAKAPDDKSPVNRLRKMLRRIEMRRLETARESVA